MLPLSAIDAITPAFQHTLRLLGTPRNWRFCFKLCAVALFAQMGGCNFGLNAPGRTPHDTSSAPGAVLILVIALLAVVAVILGLCFFYVGSRLQFVLFEAVLTRQRLFAPMWSRSRPIAWRWVGLKLALFLVAVLFTLPIFIPLIFHFIHSIPQGQAAPVNLTSFLAAVISLIASVFLIILVFSVCYILLLDFGLPFIALENAPAAMVVRRTFTLVRNEPGQFALYVLMRLLLGMAGAFAAYIVILLLAIILAVPLGALAFALHAALHNAGPAAYAFMIAGWVVLGAVLVSAVIIAFILLLGACFTFIQAYALFFIAGRYPLLAGLLYPGPHQPFTPPPPKPQDRSGEDPPFVFTPITG